MAKQPDPWRSLRAELAALRKQVDRLVSTSPFFGTGMHPNGDGGLDSDNYPSDGYSFTGDGNADFKGDATFDGTLDVTGDATFGGNTDIGGNLAVTGTLSLPAGIINNDALANPVVPDGKYGSATGFAITFAGAFVASTTQTIPSGCTGCIAMASGRVLGQNTTAGSDQLYTSIGINGSFPTQFPTGVGAGTGNTSTATRAANLTGLTPGGTITVAIYASTGVANWASNPNNAADISATFLFLR